MKMTGPSKLTLLAGLCLVVSPWMETVFQPPLYGLALFLAFASGWPRAESSPRLNFLRTPDGRLTASNYFKFASALAMLVTFLVGVLLYSI